jgi:hypothetical protein
MSNKISFLKDKTDGTYQIHFAKNAKILIQSLFNAKLLQAHTSTITDNYQTLLIKAKSITKFDDFLIDQYQTNTQQQFENKKYEFALQIIQDLMKQLKSLLNYKHTFYAFSLEHLFVIDNQHFIYLNLDHLLPLDIESKIKKQNPTITLKIPFQREKHGLFLSPEIQEMNELPFSLDYKSIYYSLGALILYFLFDKQMNEIQENNNDTIIKILKPIKETKLYWFLVRITNKNPEERWLYF